MTRPDGGKRIYHDRAARRDQWLSTVENSLDGMRRDIRAGRYERAASRAAAAANGLLKAAAWDAERNALSDERDG